MPGMDGLEVCKCLKADSETQEIPIIFLTAKTEAEEIVKGFEAGGVDYITKPFHPQELLVRVNTHVQLRSLQASLENQVRERTADFAAANQELRELIHVLCHELKTPVSGIGRLLDWFLREYAETFDEQGEHYVKLLKNRAERLYETLDGAVYYAGLSRRRSECMTLPMRPLLCAIIEQLAPPEHIAVTIQEELPKVYGHRELITQAFRQIVKNAFDFMDKSVGQVTIRCCHDGAFWLFQVIDNGPGIALKYQDKIFNLFESLHSSEGGEHLGIGLALARKIIAGHGGKIWIDSQPGTGSTVWVALPRDAATATGENTGFSVFRQC